MTMFGDKRNPPPAHGRFVRATHDCAHVVVDIPRCWHCAEQQRRDIAIAACGVVAGAVIFCGGYLMASSGREPPYVFLGSSLVTAIFLGIVGAQVGLCVAALVAFRVINRSMARRSVYDHPDVVALKECGWSYYHPAESTHAPSRLTSTQPLDGQRRLTTGRVIAEQE
jgi:hypothetical protein